MAKGHPFFNDADIAVTTAMIVDANVTTAKIANANVTLAKLAAGIAPAFIVVAAGSASLPNAAATSDVTLSGLVSTDIFIVTPSVMGTKTTALQALYKSATAMTITSSANTATNDKAFYLVLRAAA